MSKDKILRLEGFFLGEALYGFKPENSLAILALFSWRKLYVELFLIQTYQDQSLKIKSWIVFFLWTLKEFLRFQSLEIPLKPNSHLLKMRGAFKWNLLTLIIKFQCLEDDSWSSRCILFKKWIYFKRRYIKIEVYVWKSIFY